METRKESDYQMLFDMSINHIRKQGGGAFIPRLVNPDEDSDITFGPGKCTYNHPDTGRGCAAAPFIENVGDLDEYYASASFAGVLMLGEGTKVNPIARLNSGFVGQLQSVHDISATAAYSDGENSDEIFMTHYEENMAELASTHNLEYTEAA